MRFMIIRKADASTEAGRMPSEALIAAMGRYNEALVKAGVMLGGDGLQPTARGARVSFSDGRPTVMDGPFTEAKELIAGFTLIQARSLDEAIEWARRWPVEDADGAVQLEIRPVYEISDFGDSEGLRELERLRERVARG